MTSEVDLYKLTLTDSVKAKFNTLCNVHSGARGRVCLCVDVNECSLFPTLCTHGRCRNTVGSFICTCNAGYELDLDRINCTGQSLSQHPHSVHTFTGLRHWHQTHRGNRSFTPGLLTVTGQTYPFAPVLFGQ